MRYRVCTLVPLIALLIGGALGAQAADRPQAALERAEAPTVFKVVIWYDRSRPFDTFRSQAYNLARGEYTQAVEDWRVMLERSYPGYTVLVRDVAVTGGDPAQKVAATVDDEKYALARLILQKYRVENGNNATYDAGYHGLANLTTPRRNANGYPFKNPIPGAPRLPYFGGPSGASRPSYLYPNPFPYPRPHP
jgi:hypothetical protein